MQAQRKYESVTVEPVAKTPAAQPADIEFASWDDAIAASPARQLHQDLVRHFERATMPQGEMQVQGAVAIEKWSMPTRLTIILGGSALLWVGCVAAIAAII